MGDNVRDEFEGNDSEEDIERPPTPQFHDGGADGGSPEASRLSDISDNESNDVPGKSSEDTGYILEESVDDPDEEMAGEERNNDRTSVSTSPASVEQGLSPASSSEENDSRKGEDLGEGQQGSEVDVSAELTKGKSDKENAMELIDDKDRTSSEETELKKTPQELEEDVENFPHEEKKTDNAGEKLQRHRQHSITSGAGTEDEDLDMSMSPIGDLGLSGMETEIVDDILKGDVSDFLPGGNKEQSSELGGQFTVCSRWAY